MSTVSGDTFPRQHARTQRLTLGEPRSFTVSPDGARTVFLRSRSGGDSVNTLWVLDTATGGERELLDPRIVGTDLSSLTSEERRRRERAREGAGGIVSYACDAALTRCVALAGSHVVVVDVITGETTVPPIEPGVFDVRLSPDGQRLSYVRDGSLCVSDPSGNEFVVAHDSSPMVTWGLAEFIAAEEMGRHRGYWWSPDSRSIAVCRVDECAVPVWHIADPARPEHEPAAHRYPAAGTTNAEVTLHVVHLDDGRTVDVDLGTGWEYLTTVAWGGAGLIAQTQTRHQRSVEVRRIDPTDGRSTSIFTDHDDAWVELVPGVPALLGDGRLVTCADRDGSRRVMVDGQPVTPPSMQVRQVVSVLDHVVFIANNLDTPWVHDAWWWSGESGDVQRLSDAGGVVSVSGARDAHVMRTASLRETRATFHVVTPAGSIRIASHAEEPLVSPNVRIMEVGASRIPVAVLVPDDGLDTKLPVLFDPYGGPHAQRVLSSTAAFATSQWFADQGFVVVVADNAGTPGRGSASERAVLLDLATPVLNDQVEVARALADIEPRADLARVAIRGWSFGGYLAALAVLRRGDVFHAAVAGAPVTDWRLYDTHYTERYLGHPSLDDGPYAATSLIGDAHRLSRPLLIVHGLADDNVVAAHTLRLSSALLAAGKPHEVLPLSGVTHMTPQEIVAENLLLHQLEFLRRHLA